MNEQPYSIRELDAHFNEVKGMISSLRSDVKAVDEKVTLTNGRVKALELWRAFFAGSVGVIILIGLPILGYLALRVVEYNPCTTSCSSIIDTIK